MTNKFAGLLVSSSVIALFASPVFAADLAYKAPPRSYVPQAAYSWSGMYIGGNVGYGWGKSTVDSSLPAASVPDLIDNGLDQVAGDFQLTPDQITGISAITSGNTGFSQSSRMKGVIGGAQIGFNAQTGAFVFGFEADFQGSGEKGDVSRLDPFSIAITATAPGPTPLVGTLDGSTLTQYTSKIDWFGTVRGRLGVAADNVLFYATGGLAYGRVKLDGTMSTTSSVTATTPNLGTFPLDDDFASFGGSKVKFGWTLGGGIEWAVNNNWSFKAEYLYMDLGSLNYSGTSEAGIDYDVHAKITNQVARVGFNYKFGGSPF